MNMCYWRPPSHAAAMRLSMISKMHGDIVKRGRFFIPELMCLSGSWCGGAHASAGKQYGRYGCVHLHRSPSAKTSSGPSSATAGTPCLPDRRYGRLRELLLDACGVGAEGTAALVAAIVQQPPQQQQMGQSQDEQQLRKQRKQHHQREQQQLGQLRNSSAGALKTSLDGTGNRGSFAGEKGALSSGVITSSDAGMLGASISGSVAVSAAARPGKGLLSLELSNNAIGKQGLHALSGAVPLMATLQELLLRDCQVRGHGHGHVSACNITSKSAPQP
eukprot:158253-Pelagomonas_calceolata.AAC.4